MTKLEEVARAICEADNHAWPEDDYNGRFQRRAFLKQARAAIAAMREPTEAMTYAGDDAADQPFRLAKHVWTTMIDEALK